LRHGFRVLPRSGFATVGVCHGQGLVWLGFAYDVYPPTSHARGHLVTHLPGTSGRKDRSSSVSAMDTNVKCAGAICSAHSGNFQCTFRERSVHIQETCRAHSEKPSAQIQGTFSAHLGTVQCTFRKYSGHIQKNLQRTFRERSVHIWGPFSAHSGTVQCTFRKPSVHIQGTFSAHSGNVQRTFRERSVHIQGTFSAHSGNVQCTFRER
jgi:hypothetical protein